jgi:hypothetical protein
MEQLFRFFLVSLVFGGFGIAAFCRRHVGQPHDRKIQSSRGSCAFLFVSNVLEYIWQMLCRCIQHGCFVGDVWSDDSWKRATWVPCLKSDRLISQYPFATHDSDSQKFCSPQDKCTLGESKLFPVHEYIYIVWNLQVVGSDLHNFHASKSKAA